MSIFDYMNWVSGYIINKMENKKIEDNNINFNIKYSRNSKYNDSCYIIEEKNIYGETPLHMEFPCRNKEEFYKAVNVLLIEYFKNSDLLAYSGIVNQKEFSIVSINGSTISLEIENEIDHKMFQEFKRYLDEPKEIMEKEDVQVLRKDYVVI